MSVLFQHTSMYTIQYSTRKFNPLMSGDKMSRQVVRVPVTRDELFCHGFYIWLVCQVIGYVAVGHSRMGE